MKKLNDFLDFIKRNRYRQMNFWLVLIVFLFLPMPTTYSDFEIMPGKPVVRDIQINFPSIAPYPVNITNQPSPWLTATSALIIDVPSKTIIYAKNPDTQLLPASTTKIITALVSLDYYQLDQVLEVKGLKADGQTIRLENGEKMTAKNLLYGLLVQSGNDAGEVFAENYPGGRGKFIEAMNSKAQKYHLDKTHFANPTGVDENNHFTTVHDLVILASEAIKNPVFSEIVGTKKIEITDITGEKKYPLINVNKLLSVVPGLKGIKTGWTENAGECLVAYIERDEKKIISAVLNSQDRFGETTKLVEWVFGNFKWEPIPSSPLSSPEDKQ